MGDFIHLSIDLDSSNLALVAPDRRERLLKESHRFADDLRRRDVPTIWVAFPKGNADFHFIGEATCWPLQRQRSWQQIKLAGFDRMGIRADEDIFIKGDADSFRGGILAEHIRRKYAARFVLVSGGTTTICVPSTLRGAALAGLGCWVVYDRLYSLMGWDCDPLRHREYLIERVQKERIVAHVINASEILRVLPLQPAPERVKRLSVGIPCLD